MNGEWSCIFIALFQSTVLSKCFTTIATFAHSHPHIDTQMAEAAMQDTNCSSGAIWGSVSCSRTLQHAGGDSWDSNKRPSDYYMTRSTS